MPKSTFDNIDPAKKKHITEVFLEEFTLNDYDNASITQVVKKLGIAKGSIYQYFENKKDIFMYLVQHCATKKQLLTAAVRREDYDNFWSFFRDLYDKGYQLTGVYPLESAFLYRLSENSKAPSMQSIHKQWKEQALQKMEYWIQREVNVGAFRKDLPVSVLAFYLFAVSENVLEALKIWEGVDPVDNAKKGRPVFDQLNKEKFMRVIDNNIAFMKPAMQAPQNLKEYGSNKN